MKSNNVVKNVLCFNQGFISFGKITTRSLPHPKLWQVAILHLNVDPCCHWATCRSLIKFLVFSSMVVREVFCVCFCWCFSHIFKNRWFLVWVFFWRNIIIWFFWGVFGRFPKIGVFFWYFSLIFQILMFFSGGYFWCFFLYIF